MDPTKRYLALTLMDLCESQQLEKITVTSLVQAAGVTRPTFYNHFEDMSAAILYASFFTLNTVEQGSMTTEEYMRLTCENCLKHPAFFTQLANVGTWEAQWKQGFDFLETRNDERLAQEGLTGEKLTLAREAFALAAQCFGTVWRYWWAGGMTIPVDVVVNQLVAISQAMPESHIMA